MTPEPDIEKLREEIAALVGDAFVTCGSYTVEKPDALDTADKILAIPAIRDRLSLQPIAPMPTRR